jgi:ribosome-associated protein
LALDLRELANFTDYFVICDASSERQVRAICEQITAALKSAGHRLLHVEGEDDALWILLDCGAVVVHIFRSDRRRYYELERLWADAPVVYRGGVSDASEEDEQVELPWP